ncbi:toxin [bacterium]|nr:toxin [bacterium]
MRELNWDLEKSKKLKKSRGVSFEELIQGHLLAVKKHPTRKQQQILLFEYENYIWVVPCVVTRHEIFLKTLFPSRKYTKLWKEGKLNE